MISETVGRFVFPPHKGANLTYDAFFASRMGFRDANGNLTSDGTNTYTWNARNQLVSISGVASASFQYDPFGRRVSKTIGGTTQYLYDGANPVQEISGSAASANLLTGGFRHLMNGLAEPNVAEWSEVQSR